MVRPQESLLPNTYDGNELGSLLILGDEDGAGEGSRLTLGLELGHGVEMDGCDDTDGL